MIKSAPTIGAALPVYNGERHIADSLESLLTQAFTEILVIDDESTDATKRIVETIAKNDNRVRLLSIKKRNQGVARNQAIQTLSTDYVMFIDSDDRIAPDCLERLQETIDGQPDILRFDWQFFGQNGSEYTLDYEDLDAQLFRNSPRLTGADCDLLLDTKNFFCMTALYKRSFLLEHQITFGDSTLYEDNQFIVLAAQSAEIVQLLHEPLYYYRRESQTSVSRQRHHDDRHARAFMTAVSDCVTVFRPRHQRAPYYLLKYFISKLLIYCDERIPRRYHQEVLRSVLSDLSKLHVTEPADKQGDVFLRSLLRNRVIQDNRYQLFRAMINSKITYAKLTRTLR